MNENDHKRGYGICKYYTILDFVLKKDPAKKEKQKQKQKQLKSKMKMRIKKTMKMWLI